MAAAYDHPGEASGWNKLAERLFQSYDAKFGSELPKDYGSYCVLWPCRLYPLNSGKAHSQFDGFGEQHSESWRYFPLATAHQSLLTGNRKARIRHGPQPSSRGRDAGLGCSIIDLPRDVRDVVVMFGN